MIPRSLGNPRRGGVHVRPGLPRPKAPLAALLLAIAGAAAAGRTTIDLRQAIALAVQSHGDWAALPDCDAEGFDGLWLDA